MLQSAVLTKGKPKMLTRCVLNVGLINCWKISTNHWVTYYYLYVGAVIVFGCLQQCLLLMLFQFIMYIIQVRVLVNLLLQECRATSLSLYSLTLSRISVLILISINACLIIGAVVGICLGLTTPKQNQVILGMMIIVARLYITQQRKLNAKLVLGVRSTRSAYTTGRVFAGIPLYYQPRHLHSVQCTVR